MGVDGRAEPDAAAVATAEDRWIVSRLERVSGRVGELFDEFRFSPAVLELYDAFWSELCDWYLELAKPRLYGNDNVAVSCVLLHALERTLALLHPVMPFVTEEIWSYLPGRGGAGEAGGPGLLAASEWPVPDESRIDPEAEAEVQRVIEVVTDLRRYRDEVGAKASALIPARLAADGYDPATRAQIARLARFELVDPALPDGDVFATLPVPGGAVQVLRSDAFDPAAAEQRLMKRRQQLSAEIERAERKLANERFVAKAPAEVVEQERRKLDEYRRALERLGQ
jgi:valyl-tRNA synthetase